jgi:hypothetical protein
MNTVFCKENFFNPSQNFYLEKEIYNSKIQHRFNGSLDLLLLNICTIHAFVVGSLLGVARNSESLNCTARN